MAPEAERLELAVTTHGWSDRQPRPPVLSLQTDLARHLCRSAGFSDVRIQPVNGPARRALGGDSPANPVLQKVGVSDS